MREDEALVELLRLLKRFGYRFTAVTPATHQRILARECRIPTLCDIFGWNRPFASQDLPPDLLEALSGSGMLERLGKALRSKVRVASLGDDLFLHSAFPTTQADAVFFGPDTYRFARFVRRELARREAPAWIVDIGAGSGAGAIVAGQLAPDARVTAVDVNARALRFALINAQAAGARLETALASQVPLGADLVIANPPYIMDRAGRTYRDGGGLSGGEVALDWARQALRTMVPGGTMLLYSGAAIVDGHAPLVEALQDVCRDAGAGLEFDETDPDVFGEELEEPAYADVERIAIICAVIRKSPAAAAVP